MQVKYDNESTTKSNREILSFVSLLLACCPPYVYITFQVTCLTVPSIPTEKINIVFCTTSGHQISKKHFLKFDWRLNYLRVGGRSLETEITNGITTKRKKVNERVWIYDWTSVWMDEWTYERMSQWMNAWINECVNERFRERRGSGAHPYLVPNDLPS